jgi:glycerophosphoryl diester phosphodiesterase
MIAQLHMATFSKIAHRGASGNFPENTALAFEKAIEASANMIEMDCQLSQDGHVVIFHDERLGRTAGARGRLKDKTLDQLKKLDVGQWRKKSYKGERILTLEEALEIIGGRADLCLDIKHFPDGRPGIEIKLLFIVSRYDYLDRTIFSSFDYRCLSRVRELAPEARIGVIFDAATKADPLAAAKELTAGTVHIHKDLVSREFLERAWEQGRDVYVWTVNEVRDMEKLVSWGVQGIASDFPEKFWKLKWKSS